MIDLGDILTLDAVSHGARPASKKALLRTIVDLAASVTGLDAAAIEAPLRAREKLGSTGFGRGIAIPHAQLDELDRVHGLTLRLAASVDYDSVDGMPVDLVFALFSPRHSGAGHLKALAQVSRMLRNEAFVAKLRGARSSDALLALLTDARPADAA